jgi:DNA polymerase III subunit gamma/tau
MADEQASPSLLGDEPSLGLDLGSDHGLPPVAPQSSSASPYRVLARKYRPARFEDLIGQEAMVRTLTNAFALNRIHQAYLLTGVRGIGKTTTARILARAFNYELPARDGQPAINGPSVHMPALGVHCQAIIESRHVDVIEMDAASHTSVDDVREIIENARYRPVMARCKVYIIDEVHMLSKSAFNALLKTLEEPPDHVRFVFATTEIDKVPITVRSRCMRFDLRRIEADMLTHHLSGICAQEHVAIAPEALALIARASEGSVRDSLSLLDQAIAHGPHSGEDIISASALRTMLGVADRGRLIDLFIAAMKGDVAVSIANVREQYAGGADPQHLIADLAEFTHYVTLLKVAPPAQRDLSVSEDEYKRGLECAERLSLASLTRAWQVLSAGMQEMRDSARPLACANMILVRMAHASDLPTPDDLIKRLNAQGSASPAAVVSPSAATSPASSAPQNKSSTPAMGSASAVMSAPSMPPAPALRMAASNLMRAQASPVQEHEQAHDHAQVTSPRVIISGLEDIVRLAQVHRDIQLKIALERDVHLVRFEQGSIEFSLAEGASSQLAQNMMRRLQEWTGQRWMVVISREHGAPTLKQQYDAQAKEKLTGVRALPLVHAALEIFTGAEIIAVRSADTDTPPTGAEDDVSYHDSSSPEDDF